MKRFIINIIVLIFFFTLPWWCTAIACIAALFLAPPFWEIILWGFLSDIFYGVGGAFHGVPFFATICAIIVYFCSLPIQKQILRRE